jgi:hypothetical protein
MDESKRMEIMLGWKLCWHWKLKAIKL